MGFRDMERTIMRRNKKYIALHVKISSKRAIWLKDSLLGGNPGFNLTSWKSSKKRLKIVEMTG